MSSILEALRELESERARAKEHKTTSVVDTPREPERSLGAVIPLLGGLSLGVVVFGVYVWSAALPGAGPDAAAVPAAPAVPSGESGLEAGSSTRGPEWLERAEPPRARVTPPPAPAVPEPAAVVSRSEPVRDAPPAAPPPVLPKSPNTRFGGDQQVRLEAISYAANAEQRTATLLVNGRRAVLHQRESLGGVEVQLIMSDGVYLQRGSEVFFVVRPR